MDNSPLKIPTSAHTRKYQPALSEPLQHTSRHLPPPPRPLGGGLRPISTAGLFTSQPPPHPLRRFCALPTVPLAHTAMLHPPQEDFEFCFQDTFFVAEDHTGTVTELIPRGASTALTWANREEYIALLQRHLLSKGALQEDAIREGLFTVVPQTVVDFLTWQVTGAVGGAGTRAVVAGGAPHTGHTLNMFWGLLGQEGLLGLRTRGKVLLEATLA